MGVAGHAGPSGVQPHIRGEVLLEFRQLGNVVKVSAIHVDTDTEVCLAGPSTAGRYVLTAAVVNKLIYVLHKRKDCALWVVGPSRNSS